MREFKVTATLLPNESDPEGMQNVSTEKATDAYHAAFIMGAKSMIGTLADFFPLLALAGNEVKEVLDIITEEVTVSVSE